MSHPFEIKFTLQQHTPIIHFQHNQAGATLRATEVKPKLDQFIIEKNGGIKKCREEHKDWFLSENHNALNYKLRIEANDNESIKIERFHKNAPMYFGNMGKENPPKHFKIQDFTNCKIYCLNKSLLEEIEKVLVAFFNSNNFGTRQSKGYGSFEITNINEKATEKSIPNHKFKFTIKSGDWQETLIHLNLFYKSLRSGINVISGITYNPPYNQEKAHKQQLTNSIFYFKPLIFLYAKHLKKQWDKKTIKQKYLNDYAYRWLSSKEKSDRKLNWINGNKDQMEELGLNQHIAKYNKVDILSYSEKNKKDEMFKDFKDVFGLSSSEQWKSYGKVITKENASNSINSSTPRIFTKKNKLDNDFIERFKSPLFFKPLKTDVNEFTIYVQYSELPQEYKGQKFIIYDNKAERFPKLCLEIPSNFSFENFFEYVFNKSNFDIEKHIYSYKNYSNPNEMNINYYNSLKDIFDQLQNSDLK